MNGRWNYRDKASLIRGVLRAELDTRDRRVMCACVGLANDDGFLEPDVCLIAPMTGLRRAYVEQALKALEHREWITRVSDKHKITIPLTFKALDKDLE